VSDWLDALVEALTSDGLRPLVDCLAGDASLVFLYGVFNATTAVACLAIGCALWSRRRIIVDLNMAAKVLFATFFFLCAGVRAVLVLTLFRSAYILEVTILAAGAGVSLVTAVFTVRTLWQEPTPLG
jgi:hypothetical protein